MGTYTKSEAAYQAWENQIRTFDLSKMNNTYYESFREAKYPDYKTNKSQNNSWLQYKSTIGRFFESIQKDALMVTEEDIKTFTEQFDNDNTRNAKIAHIKAFLVHIIKNDVANAQTRVTKKMLFMLLGL